MTQIQTQLNRLQKPHWLPAFKLIIHHFIGAQINEQHNVAQGILEVLQSLIPHDKNNESLAIERLQKMFCFHYRFYKTHTSSEAKTGATTFWDPMAESFHDFSQDENINIERYEWDTSHPAPDIIMCWFSEHFNNALTLN
ncbi:MAG: hypothetical protein KZQ57_03175 [gamma proteobacterium symbiont of Lucinoma myriamae]|nr:hypothetical protein [gamma proteobacterium symbiont of Lucinoma myriamae]